MFSIDTRRSGKKGIKAIVVNLNDQMVLFNGKSKVQLEKISDEVENNLFLCLNQYVEAVLTTEEKIKLFKLYSKAHHIVEFGKFYDYNNEISQLKPIVDNILDMINISKYCGYIQNSEHLVIPRNLSEASSKGDYPLETTITDQDYVNLVKLAFVARATYPIIFGLLNRFDQIMGAGYSEIVCGELLSSNILITSMPGWKKLETYFKHSFDKRGFPTQIDGGGGSETFIKKVLYSAIFDRLCCAVIPETEKDKNIANGINGAVRQHENSVVFKAKESRPGGDDEDKRSSLDKYGITAETKEADQEADAEFFSFGLFDETDKPRFVDRFKYQCLALNIKNEKLVEKVYDNLPVNWDFDLHEHVHQLLMLVYSGDVSSFIWEACSYTQITAAIALAQVKLSEMGFTYLPSVLGAQVDPTGIRSLADGLRLTDEDKNYLSSICDVQSRNSENRGYNEAILNADAFMTSLGQGIWRSNLEYGVLENETIYDRVSAGDLFSIDLENAIKTEFMTLIRKVNA